MAFHPRRSRTVEKPKRPSKSIATLKAILDAHSWHSMATCRPPCSSPEEVKKWMRFLYESAKYALRDTDIGFLIKREFGDDDKNAHFHIVFTKPLPESIEASLKTSFLRKAGLETNRGRQFKYDCHDPTGKTDQPKLREYLKKVAKYSMDTIHPPKGWDPKALGRLYKVHRLGPIKDILSPPASPSLNSLSVMEHNWTRKEECQKCIPADPYNGAVNSLEIRRKAQDLNQRFSPRYGT